MRESIKNDNRIARREQKRIARRRQNRITIVTIITTVCIIGTSITVLAAPASVNSETEAKKISLPSAGIGKVVSDYAEIADESDVSILASHVMKKTNTFVASSGETKQNSTAASNKIAAADTTKTTKDKTTETTEEKSSDNEEVKLQSESNGSIKVVYAGSETETYAHDLYVYEEETDAVVENSEDMYSEDVDYSLIEAGASYEEAGLLGEVEGGYEEPYAEEAEAYAAEADVYTEEAGDVYSEEYVQPEENYEEAEVQSEEIYYEPETVMDQILGELDGGEQYQEVYEEETQAVEEYTEAVQEEPVYEEETVEQFLEEQDQRLAEEAAAREAAEAEAAAQEQTESSTAGLGAEIAANACQYVGTLPYVWAGASLTDGVDCSGFTMAIYAQYGYSLSHDSNVQSCQGRSVPLSEAQPGDIVVYSGHVAMYIGNGQIVHAPTEGQMVSIASVDMMPVLDVRRILE